MVNLGKVFKSDDIQVLNIAFHGSSYHVAVLQNVVLVG